MDGIRTRGGAVCSASPVASVVKVFDVCRVADGKRVGFIQNTLFCFIPTAGVRLRVVGVLEEVCRRAVKLGLIPLPSGSDPLRP